MKKSFVNNTHIEGLVYEHKLEKKIAGEKAKNPGVEFINGTLDIVTDNDKMNVVSVHFSYVTETTSKGKPNATFGILSNIIDGKIGSVMEHGAENAGKVRIDSALDLNEWFDSQTDNLVSIKRNEGGFVHTVSALGSENQRATFETDILITGAVRYEEDSERQQPEKVVVKGYIFNFRKKPLPVSYVVFAPRAMDYFEGLEASPKNPVFTKVSGQQISKEFIKRIEEEGAFGDTFVKEIPSVQKDFVITWAQAIPYEWDSEDTLLASELADMLAKREVDLADIKCRQQEYQANKNNALAGPTDSIKKSNYDF